MDRHPIPRRVALSAMLTAAGLGLGACSSVAVHAPMDIETTVDHHVASELSVETFTGAIEIVIDPSRSDVHVRMTGRVAAATREDADRRAAASTIDISRDDSGRLVVRPELAEARRGEDEASLVVTAPAVLGAHLRTTNGSIAAAHVTGPVDAWTTNGRIRLADIDGVVRAVTTNGTVELTRGATSAELRTTNGNVTATEVAGRIVATTTNGSVTLTEVIGPIDVATTNGSVRVGLWEGFLGSLEVGTTNGRIAVSRGGDSLASMRGGSAVVTIAPGGEMSRIRASNGSVTVTIGDGTSG